MSEFESLKNEIQSIIELSSENVFEYAKRETLHSKLERVKKIEKILEIKKYKLVFIGTVGAGKTTAISHLFNLTSLIKKTVKKGKKSKSIESIEPLLSTGSGRTTICEVEIKFSEQIAIEIEPYSQKDIKQQIEDFCESIYNEVNPKDNENSPKNIISIELERAIRSIIGLKELTKQNTDEDGKKNIEKIDLAKDKAKEFNSLAEFENFALAQANLNNRNESKISFNQSDDDAKKWLKTNFSKINRAEIPTFSIPKKINVYINKDIVGESRLNIFNSVIDTKGIDESPIREDLTNYIENSNTICIFTSSYNDAPETNIRDLIQYSLTKESENYQDRFITLVMPKNNEPENENDADGDWEKGIAIKKDIVKKVFKNMKLNFNDKNILFYDALEFYDSEGRIDRDYEEDIQESKDELIKNINNIIKKREEKLYEEIKNIKKDIVKLKNRKTLSKEDEYYIKDLAKKLETIKNLDNNIPNFIYEDFINKYISYYSSKYKAWNTKDAIHRRYGTFSQRGYNTYYDAKIIAEGLSNEEMLRKFTKKLKKEVEELIEILGKDVNKLEDLIPEIKIVINIEYDNFIRDVGDGVRNFLEKENKNRDFWLDLIERRGKGRGYNDEVIRMFRNKLMSLPHGLDINGVLQDFSEKEWENFINKILKFFKKI